MKRTSLILLILAILLLVFNLSCFYYQDPFYLFMPGLTVELIDFPIDKDKDGLNDLVDILEGARKEIKNKTKYKSGYYSGGYPPESEGVCTDVVWRAMANAGYDLKSSIDQDISSNINHYPRVNGSPDPNIDFRRVKNQYVFFKKFAQDLTINVIPHDPENLSQWQAGDIVVLEKPDHIAIISDKRRKDGVPYIIHNSYAYPKEENLLLSWSENKQIIGHFRYPK